MNKVYEVKGYGRYAYGIMIIAAKNREDALIYANAESESVGHIKYRDTKILEVLGEIEFEGIVSIGEFVE